MGSGRGDRNQDGNYLVSFVDLIALQWGPVVVTGIRRVLDGATAATFRIASMGSGRGDRNQPNTILSIGLERQVASMGSGRGDRNQEFRDGMWRGPEMASMGSGRGDRNQARRAYQQWRDLSASMGSGRGDRNQISGSYWTIPTSWCGFNGVRSW